MPPGKSGGDVRGGRDAAYSAGGPAPTGALAAHRRPRPHRRLRRGHCRRPAQGADQGGRLPGSAGRARSAADRASGRRRRRRRGLSRRAARPGAGGLRRPCPADRRGGPGRLGWPSGSRRTSGRGGSSPSTGCRGRRPASCSAASCADPRRTACRPTHSGEPGRQLRPEDEWATSFDIPSLQRRRSDVEPPVGIEPTTYSLRASQPHVRRRPSTYESPGQRLSADVGVRRLTTSNRDQD